MICSVGGGTLLPVGVINEIATKTEGVPLFIEELTRMVLESELPAERNSAHELTSPLPALAIPSTLYDSLMTRLDRLGTAKEVAQLAAVIGREFSYELLREISPLEEARLTGSLNRLVDAELLEEQSSAPRLGYRFKHALIRDAAYDSLLRSQRRQYHRIVGEVLRDRFADLVEAQPELLANHLTEAGLVEEAIPYWQRAGRRAIERSANQEAIVHLTKGLELLALLPATPEHLQQELLLLLILGPAVMATKGFASIEAQKVYAWAQKLTQQVGEGLVGFQVSWALWASYASRGEQYAGLEVAHECLRLAQLASDPGQLIAAHHAIGNALLCLGRFAEGLGHFEQGAALYDARHHTYMVSLCGFDTGVVCHAFRSFHLWFLGYPDQARQRLREGLALAHKLAHPSTTAIIAMIACSVYPLLRDPQAAMQEAELAISLSVEHHFEYIQARAVMAQGWALTEHGKLDKAITRLRQGLTSLQACGGEITMTYYMTTLADALRRAGRAEDALGWLAEAQAIIEKTKENWWEPELLRLNAEIILEHSGSVPDGEAEACLQRALRMARERDAKSLELRVAMSLGRLLFGKGQKSEAHRTVSEVYNWFTE